MKRSLLSTYVISALGRLDDNFMQEIADIRKLKAMNELPQTYKKPINRKSKRWN